MFKDKNVRNICLGAFFTFLFSAGGSYIIMMNNQTEYKHRITSIESAIKKQEPIIQHYSENRELLIRTVADLRVHAARLDVHREGLQRVETSVEVLTEQNEQIAKILHAIEASIGELRSTTSELGKIAARLDERSLRE